MDNNILHWNYIDSNDEYFCNSQKNIASIYKEKKKMIKKVISWLLRSKRLLWKIYKIFLPSVQISTIIEWNFLPPSAFLTAAYRPIHAGHRVACTYLLWSGSAYLVSRRRLATFVIPRRKTGSSSFRGFFTERKFQIQPREARACNADGE